MSPTNSSSKVNPVCALQVTTTGTGLAGSVTVTVSLNEKQHGPEKVRRPVDRNTWPGGTAKAVVTAPAIRKATHRQRCRNVSDVLLMLSSPALLTFEIGARIARTC